MTFRSGGFEIRKLITRGLQIPSNGEKRVMAFVILKLQQQSIAIKRIAWNKNSL
jgi:hypothetical protein